MNDPRQTATAPSDVYSAQWLTRAQAAARIGLASKTLANMHAIGDGPPVCYVGPASPRYNVGALNAWLAARTVRHSTEGDARGLTVRGRRNATLESSP